MSQNNQLHKSFLFSAFLALLTIAVALAGCTDSMLYHNVEIPDTEVVIKGEIVFKPLVTTEVQTGSRTEAPDGEKYEGIKSLYVAFFDSEGQIMTDYTDYVTFTHVPLQSSTHQRVRFEKKVQAGQYYIYAIANLSLSDKDVARFKKIKTIDELRSFKVNWNDDIAGDLEMFGVFKQDDDQKETIPDNDSFEADKLLTITPATKSIYSWVRRATSKVTVDFDGSNLKDGVTVYIKNVVLKDVPDSVCIGYNSAVGGDSINLRQSDYTITYGTGESHTSWPQITKTDTFKPQNVWSGTNIENFHDDNAPALPCYENMQGEPEGKSKLQDSDGDGLIDSSDKDGVDNGTYLEVTGYYVANRPEYKSQGKIIYRFMLGNDAVKNFDFVRNHHYKITMRFKDYGNDIDWHIVYADKYLDATYPDSVNYQGKFFVPDADYNNIPNAGHKFSDQNVITVTSFEKDNSGKHWIAPTISYTYYNYNDATGTWETDNNAEWLTLSDIKPVEGEDINPQKQYTYTAAMSEPVSIFLNTSSSFPSGELGSQNAPYNLSNKDGKSMVIENTANSYMVGAPGWYCFPLVYGNAITGKGFFSQACASPHMLNHLGKQITQPYIKDAVSLSNVRVKLIWQDADNLIETAADQLIYDPNLFGGKGGIKFHIGTIREGNAVIALIDNNADEDPLVNIDRGEIYKTSGSTKAIWSWHIWVTRFGFDGFGDDMRIINHDGNAFDVMPVNLGWCAGDKGIRYYKRRKCDITFKVGEHKIVRTILQYPHMLLPRGDHPYYQWGRKDPFVGTNLAGGNKPRWTGEGKSYLEWAQYNPPRLYVEPKIFANNAGRKHTQDCLAALVQNPDKWHNAPRDPDVPNDYEKGFHSINRSYGDLWSYSDAKTVYDPCPPGYQVSDNTPFTGFTTSGTDEVVGLNWFDVLEIDMQKDYYAGSPINGQVIEFYTDMRKIQSITFPISGYRDYDKNAGVVNYPSGDATNGWYNGEGFVWFNTAMDVTNSYHLKFRRNDFGKDADQQTAWKTREGIVAVGKEKFYNTDGFGVRPVRIQTK